MHSIQHPTALDLGTCPICPELVSLRRQIGGVNFACRFWVVCPTHDVLTDLSTWLDQAYTPTAFLDLPDAA